MQRNRENFRLPDFDRFTRFVVLNTISLILQNVYMYVCQSVCVYVCDAYFVISLKQKFIMELHEILNLVAS